MKPCFARGKLVTGAKRTELRKIHHILSCFVILLLARFCDGTGHDKLYEAEFQYFPSRTSSSLLITRFCSKENGKITQLRSGMPLVFSLIFLAIFETSILSSAKNGWFPPTCDFLSTILHEPLLEWKIESTSSLIFWNIYQRDWGREQWSVH